VTVRAAGGVVWRRDEVGDVEILLVHRPKYDDWSLPKGKNEAGESDEMCAAREVEEETGFRVTIGPEVGVTQYVDAKGRDKIVRYFAMEEPDGQFHPNHEVDEICWLRQADAVRTLSYAHDAGIVEAFTAPASNRALVPTPTAGATLPTYRRMANDPDDWFSADELQRARDYQRPLTKLRLARMAVTAVVLLVFVFADVGPRLLDALDVTNWVLQLVVIVIALEIVALLYNPAFDAWVDLVHDKKWELSTQTGKGFAVDQVKSLVLGLVVNVVLLIPLFAVIRSTDLWWLYGWLIVVGFSILIGFLFPIVIAPIFNKFTPLEDPDLAGRIQTVAGRAGVDISGAFVADESRRSRRDNAYVAGLGATRRVVLFDTLLEHPPAVVEQVVAHEIGHWQLHHLRRQIPLAALLGFVVFALLRLVAEWDWLFEQAGIPTDGSVPAIGHPASLPILLMAVQVGFGVTGLVTSWVSRAFERQADLAALELLQEPDVMLDMQRRLHTKNLSDLDPGPLKRLQATHPPAAERMAFTTAWAEANHLPV
jgi:STE24 endopeptidase